MPLVIEFTLNVLVKGDGEVLEKFWVKMDTVQIKYGRSFVRIHPCKLALAGHILEKKASTS